jgi:adenylate kinase
VTGATNVRLLLVAYPGAGKGTQATKLAANYNIAQLSSGEVLRTELARKTRVGRVAAGYLSRGDLVPDELVFEVLSPLIAKAVANGGYVLDGFPRTLSQAEMMHSAPSDITDIEPGAVIYLRVDHEELIRRLRSRAKREGRTDDSEMTIAHRFKVFDRQTEPLLDFYAGRGILLEIDGDQPVEDVFREATGAVDTLLS